jgi:peptide/nickel transport system ATP-binding protein
MSSAQLRSIRGARIGMVFQDPLSSLHPFYRVGWQVVELLREHEEKMSKREARSRAVELLGLVGIPEPARRVDDYPHQFSGGMRQRVMIAMAMALNPSLLIADEPTTALDVTVQAQILGVIQRMQEEFGTAIILITHDLGVIAEVADEVIVMYAGSVMEQAERRELFYDYYHPYTAGLLRSVPNFEGGRRRLSSIPGQPPSLISLGEGCPFGPRCSERLARCRIERPPLAAVAGRDSHLSACWLQDRPAGATSALVTPAGDPAPGEQG